MSQGAWQKARLGAGQHHFIAGARAGARVVNGRAAISADMALRLAAALGGSAESWLRMQAAYDLWQAAKKRRSKVLPLKLAA